VRTAILEVLEPFLKVSEVLKKPIISSKGLTGFFFVFVFV